MTFLFIALPYLFLAGLFGGIDNQLSTRKCKQRDHWRKPRPGHSTTEWCGHKLRSVWLAGVFWLPYLPVVLGLAIGSFNPGGILSNHRDNRRKNEIAEAEHRAELAKIRAAETAELEKALN